MSDWKPKITPEHAKREVDNDFVPDLAHDELCDCRHCMPDRRVFDLVNQRIIKYDKPTLFRCQIAKDWSENKGSDFMEKTELAERANRIRVIGTDLMCFDVDAETLAPFSVSCYDAYALDDPLPGYKETIGVNEWNLRFAKLRG